MASARSWGVRASSPGATFSVIPPLAAVRIRDTREHPGNSANVSAEAFDISLEGVNVLVVDDDDNDARELLRRLLGQCRATVFNAANAAGVLALVQLHRPHVVVSDIGMHGQDGYHFMRELRKLPALAGGNTPAIALTAFARSEDRTRAILAAYHMHMSKPIEPYELLASIASLAGRIASG